MSKQMIIHFWWEKQSIQESRDDKEGDTFKELQRVQVLGQHGCSFCN